MMLDGAGWHDARALTVPDNVTLALLPPYSPELNPPERVWLYLRERSLSLRVLDDTEAIIDACCKAWIALIEEPGSHAITLRISMDHEGDFIGSMVLYQGSLEMTLGFAFTRHAG